MSPTSEGPRIVLASGSASRRAILEGAGVPFVVDPADVDEAALKARFEGPPAELALALGEAKALDVSRRRPDDLVIGADQVLEFEGEAHDKPRDPLEARTKLARMRGRTHHLQGGVAAARGGEIVWRHRSSCAMTMRAVSDLFLDRYVERAGDILTATVGGYAYEGLGAQLFERADGDFHAILGLPLLPVLAMLRDQGALLE